MQRPSTNWTFTHFKGETSTRRIAHQPICKPLFVPFTQAVPFSAGAHAGSRCVLILFLALASVIGCSPAFRRNPNLALLRQGTTTTGSCPVWSPDGNMVYFVSESLLTNIRRLEAMRPDGSGERLLLDGNFGSICVSPDGTRLAVVSLVTASKRLGGALLLVDTSGQVIDTLSPVGDTVVCARYSMSSRSLYYYVLDRGVFKLDMETRQLDTVLLTHIGLGQDFDFWDDSLLLLPSEVHHIPSGRVDTLPVGLWQPRFCPSNPSTVSGAIMNQEGFLEQLVLVDRISDSVTDLDARPYSDCNITYPSWSPDGRNIVMAAAPLIPGGFLDPVPMVGRYDLWVLRR